MKLSGYNVAITGGSGGIGSALATGLLEDGATVYNLDSVKPADQNSNFIEVDLVDEVLIGSPTGMTMEGAGYTAYGASKAGMMGLSRIIAVDYKEVGVRSNVVVPGTMATPLIKKIWDDPEKGPDLIRRTPLGRMGDPRDLVGIVNWLVSADSSFATGASYAVDGGMTAR